VEFSLVGSLALVLSSHLQSESVLIAYVELVAISVANQRAVKVNQLMHFLPAF